MFRDPVLSASLAMSALVSTVMMATLVVGPFYLSRALGLDAALVGLVMSVGPLVAALTGVPAGRIADRFGARRMTIVGLIGMAAGSFILSMMPATLGIPGYIAPIVVITAGYALFQAANNTAVMTDVRPDQRGVISGMLNLSRNLGLITGASVMGAVFALASATIDITTARPEAVATGMRITFAVAAILIVVALAIAAWSSQRSEQLESVAQARAAVGAANRNLCTSVTFSAGQIVSRSMRRKYIDPVSFGKYASRFHRTSSVPPRAGAPVPPTAGALRAPWSGRPLPRGRAHWRARSRCRSAERRPSHGVPRRHRPRLAERDPGRGESRIGGPSSRHQRAGRWPVPAGLPPSGVPAGRGTHAERASTAARNARASTDTAS